MIFLGQVQDSGEVDCNSVLNNLLVNVKGVYFQCTLPYVVTQGARSVLRNSDLVSSLLNEWRCVDFETMSKQAIYSQQMSEASSDLIKECKWGFIITTKCTKPTS